MADNICLFCNKEFKTKRHKKYCSYKCNYTAQNRKKRKPSLCRHCGKELPLFARIYCSDKCKKNAQYLHYKRRKKRRASKKIFEVNKDEELGVQNGKIQCKICGNWYELVGSHVTATHNMLMREYKKKFGYDVKKGLLPEWLRDKKVKIALENNTVKNLKKGKKFRFKKGETYLYNRSKQTQNRLNGIVKKMIKERAGKMDILGRVQQ